MSNAYLDSAAELERIAKMFSGLVALGPELTRVGSLQQAGEEAKATLDATLEAIAASKAAAEADLAAVVDKITVAKEQHQQTIDATKAEAETIRAAAVAWAQSAKDKAESDARATAASIIAKATADAAEITGNVAVSKDQLSRLTDELVDRNSELDRVTQACAAAQAKLDGIQREIAKLRDRF